ncbi:hypothetical protein [Natrinema soli]|uniref:Small CPxCG-related zinc finger protein n=1 Tax=Natrinema soli TaxID=1930624 RepID=A0ABD5SVD9_9EURY|nr:hypothetical protein [Natrinema soli]
MSKNEDETQKTVVACTECGDMYVARISPDGSIQPVGIVDCTCGGGNLNQIRNEYSID